MTEEYLVEPPDAWALLEGKVREHEASFDLRWKADMRAIKRWQEAHPGNDLVWPDHADMVVWLLGEVDRLTDAVSRALDQTGTDPEPYGDFAPEVSNAIIILSAALRP